MTHFLPGDIAEIIIYNKALSAGERRAIELYLGRNYRIAVSA